jgi:hypothetical protein
MIVKSNVGSMGLKLGYHLNTVVIFGLIARDEAGASLRQDNGHVN